MDYDKAASVWLEWDKKENKLSPDEVREVCIEYFKKHDTCAMAVASGSFVRNTAVSYKYRNDGEFFIFSEGGIKFRALKENPNTCLVIYDEYHPGNAKSVQVTGKATCYEPGSKAWKEVLTANGMSPERFSKFPMPMYLIVVKAEEVDFLDTSWRKQGKSPRQYLKW